MNRISVVICTYSKDRLPWVQQCLESLHRQSVEPFEKILVTDPPHEIQEFYRRKIANDTKIIMSERKGLSWARNAGVRNATGEVVAFIDDDAVADENWLENLAKNHEDSKVAGVGGETKPLWEGNPPKWLPEELYWVVGCSYKGLPEQKTCIRNPIGCNMSFRRNVFEKIGYFRSDIGRFGSKLLSGEEAELSMRITRGIPGSRIVHDPSAVVYHRVTRSRTSIKYILMRSFNEGISKRMIVGNGSTSTLSTESQYLGFILTKGVPSRLRQLYKPANLCQLLVMGMCVAAVYIGFVRAK